MAGRILITGSSGLIGQALKRNLELLGECVVGLDIRGQPDVLRDICELGDAEPALEHVVGIVHLAAVSRVLDGQRDPAFCRLVNVDGTKAVIDCAARLPSRPWIIYASSREVYGKQSELPVREDAVLKPLNHYAHSKADAESLVLAARSCGIRTVIVRFSNVYGDVSDHVDRVVPAFARAAATQSLIRVDGGGTVLDFTHVSDVAMGLTKLINRIRNDEEAVDPVHFVSGYPTSLSELAALAVEFGADASRIIENSPRSYDVDRFYGDPARALSLLSWSHTTALRDGFGRLVQAYREQLPLDSRA